MLSLIKKLVNLFKLIDLVLFFYPRHSNNIYFLFRLLFAFNFSCFLPYFFGFQKLNLGRNFTILSIVNCSKSSFAFFFHCFRLIFFGNFFASKQLIFGVIFQFFVVISIGDMQSRLDRDSDLRFLLVLFLFNIGLYFEFIFLCFCFVAKLHVFLLLLFCI